MKRDLKNAKRSVGCWTLIVMMGVLLSSCGMKIRVEETGKAYDVNESSKVLETYEQYNIQAPVEQMAGELMEEGFQNLTLQSHTVTVADEDASENGKYDAVDTIVAVAEGANPTGIFPQTMEITAQYKRDASTLEWIVTDKTCKKWKIEHKEIGGTAWKLSSPEGDTYIRLRDTIEFFYTKVKQGEESTKKAEFDTTLLGLMATISEGEKKLERIHVSGGTVSATGIITLKLQVEQEQEIEVVLNDFERIEKIALPFTEEEFQSIAVR